MKILAILNPENVSDDEVKKYSIRKAARAIVFDENKLIALLDVSKEKYYKLPGGGVEKLEDFKETLKRECLEEIGSNIDIITELGSIVEYRKCFNLKQTSYCYIARLKGKKEESSFTKKELGQGFNSIWLPYDEALNVISKNIATSFEGSSYIVPRETIFLKEAKKYLDKLI